MKTFLVLALLVFAIEAMSQVSTDAFGFTNSADVVGDTIIQIETEFDYESVELSNGLTQNYKTYGTLIRIGLGPTHELRVAPPKWTESGWYDLNIGVKFNASKGDMLDVSFIGTWGMLFPSVDIFGGANYGYIKLSMPVAQSVESRLKFSLEPSFGVKSVRTRGYPNNSFLFPEGSNSMALTFKIIDVLQFRVEHLFRVYRGRDININHKPTWDKYHRIGSSIQVEMLPNLIFNVSVANQLENFIEMNNLYIKGGVTFNFAYKR